VADTKLTDLTAIGTPAFEDLLYLVDDPSGSPLSRKMTLLQLAGLLTKFVYKTGDESLNTSTALQADDELLFAIGANEVWEFEFVVYYLGNTTGEFRCGLTFPTTPTEISYDLFGPMQGTVANGAGTSTDTTALTMLHSTSSAVAGQPFGADTNQATVRLRGYVRNGANAGNVTLMWAQETSNGTNTTVKAGSFLTARRVA